MLEFIYEACLRHEFDEAGLRYTRQQPLPVQYKGRAAESEFPTDCEFRLDPVVEQSLLLEIEAVHRLHPIHDAQLLTCLRLSGLRLGLLLNFNEVALKDGIHRRRL